MKKEYLRDYKGRFAKVPYTRRYNVDDIKRAWFDGHKSAFGVITTPTRRLEMFLQENDIN